MTEPTYGLTAGAAKVLQEMADKHRQRLPDTGRRTRRVFQGGTGAVRVIGPCVAYTPDVGDPDTDFEEAYPGGCDGPDVLGLNVKNLGTGVTSVVRMEVQSTGPLTFSSDTFSFSCASSTINVYAVVVFNDLDIEGVVATIYLDSDDSVVQAYTNTIYSWNPLAGGNLQMGPSSTSCDCGTLPYDLCISIPTR